jgi:hypothetical protein
MQTTPGHTTAYRRTITLESGFHDGGEPELLTPAERIALTITVINRGLDVMNGVARTSLRECRWGAGRGHHLEQERQPRRGI